MTSWLTYVDIVLDSGFSAPWPPNGTGAQLPSAGPTGSAGAEAHAAKPVSRIDNGDLLGVI